MSNEKDEFSEFAVTTKENFGVSEVSGLDFDKIYSKAIEIFNEQSMITETSGEISLASLEISKKKAENFLSSMSGILEIAHQVEVLSAEKDKFRRRDELSVLNSLRRSCAKASNTLEGVLSMAEEKMSAMMKDPEGVDPESIALLQSVLHQNIETVQKLVSGFSRLVQLERMSGGRPFGAGRSTARDSISLIKGLDEVDQANRVGANSKPGGKIAVRPLSMDEYEDLE